MELENDAQTLLNHHTMSSYANSLSQICTLLEAPEIAINYRFLSHAKLHKCKVKFSVIMGIH